MKHTFSLLVVIFAAVLLAAPSSAFASENLFYFFKNVNGFADFQKNHKQIDIIAPQIYEVGNDLKVSKPIDKKLIKEAKKKKVDTIPLLVQKGFSKVLMSDILLNTKAQDDIIAFMIKEAKANKYAGWQFDFENINHLDRDMYTAFVAKTGEALKKEKLSFSVAVVVRSTDYDPTSKNQDWSSVYDYKNLAKHVDFLSLMTYDDPYSVGPVASLPYVERILDYMLKQAPAEKLSLGIPFYCWQWQNGVRAGSTTYNLALKAYKKGTDKTRVYDEVLGAEKFSFKTKHVEHEIWCDNDQSFEAKQALIDEHGLRGFSVWALGQGDSAIWSLLKKQDKQNTVAGK
jgi:spore germination protein YaaH